MSRWRGAARSAVTAGSPELRGQAAKENLPVSIETLDVDSDESVRQVFGRILRTDLWTCR